MIRLLVALLLVANVLLFLYGYLGVEKATTSQEPIRPPDVGSLRLLSARVVEPQAEAPVESGQQADSTTVAESEILPPEPTPAEEPESQPAPPVTAEPESATARTEPPAGESPQPSEQTADETQAESEPERPQAPPPSEPVAGQPPAEPEPMAAEEPPAAAPDQKPPAEAAAEAPEPPSAAKPTGWCGAVGPFRTARQAQAWLETLGAESGGRVEERPTWVEKSYWVYLPPRPSRAEAVALEKKLKAAGVTDLWRLRKGEMRNAISLGLYTRKDAAEKRLRSLQAKGFDARLKTTREQLPRYWIRFEPWPGSKSELASRKRPDGARLQNEACR